MSFFKHIGEANGKKVIIVQRQLPGEEHMAGVIFSEIMPGRFHDDLMKELESDAGQTANEFRDVLERRYFSDGRNMLEAMMADGYVKRVASNAVTVKPNSKSSIKLDELNKMLTDIRAGRVATEELKSIQQPAPAYESVKVSESTAEAAPVASTADDRLAKLENLVMKLAETVGEMAPKKGPGRPKKAS